MKKMPPNARTQSPQPLDTQELMKKALKELRHLRNKVKTMAAERTEPIAVIGMACRFPGADSIESYWKLLAEGRHAISEVPADRWSLNQFYDPEPGAQGKVYSRYGGYIGSLDGFDAQFFGISPKEASCMDPQQRVALEVTWEALENAHINPQNIYGSNTGVFLGIGNWENAVIRFGLADPATLGPYEGTGSCGCVAAGRIAYVLGLTGPNMAIDTACSSSLLSAHLACESLRRKECDMALTGGSHLLLLPGMSICFCRAGMLSPDGLSKAFDASANGYVRSEGCGMVVLKRLSDAQKAGDRIWAVIRGSAVNQDGSSGGLTVPSGPSQEAVIKNALKNAELTPDEIGYIEAHGTGTPLGDPIEMRALGNVFCKQRRPYPLTVGSVKTNIGHLECAAGVSALIKTILMLHYRQIPAHLHLKDPTPHIEWDKLDVEIPTRLRPWTPPEERSRIAGISSFGFSGTNVHAILEEYQEESASQKFPVLQTDVSPAPPEDTRSHYLLLLSAHQPEALEALARRYRDYGDAYPEYHPAEICHGALVHRAHHDFRLAVIGKTLNDLTARLADFIQPQSHPLVMSNITQVPDLQPTPIASGPPTGVADKIFEAAQSYVHQGKTYSWQHLYPGPLPIKRQLPLYPFQHQSFPVNPFGVRPLTSSLAQKVEGQHPLLGRRIDSPLAQTLFEAHLSPDSPDYLADHRVFGTCIFPAAAFLEMALQAGRMVFKNEWPQLQGVSILAPLVLNSQVTVQVILTEQTDQHLAFEIHSRSCTAEPSDASWTLHATGTIHHGPEIAATYTPDADTDMASAYREINRNAYYTHLKNRGFAYGEQFQVLRDIHAGDNVMQGRVSHPLHNTPSPYILHPALLDGCFQLIDHLTPQGDDQSLYIPVGFDAFRLLKKPEPNFRVTARLIKSADGFKADLTLYTESGAAMATLKGVTGRPVSRSQLSHWFGAGLTDLLYSVKWQLLSPPSQDATVENQTDTDLHVIFGRPQEKITQAFVRHIDQKGGQARVVCPRNQDSPSYPDDIDIDPFEPQAYHDLLRHLDFRPEIGLQVIYLWGATSSQTAIQDDVLNDHYLAYNWEPLLYFMQAISAVASSALTAPGRVTLTLITQGAVNVAGERFEVPPWGAMLWGFGKALAREYPALRLRMVDLDARLTADASAFGPAIDTALASDSHESQLTWRHGQWYVPRLMPYVALPDPTQDPFRLSLKDDYGLDRLIRVPAQPMPPAPNEVQINVHAAGLNFRDVLHALGMLSSVTQSMGFSSAGEVPLGFECSGIITAKGNQVHHLEVGEAVVAALAKGSLASYVNVPADFVVRKPDNVGFKAAATLSTVYLTAYYGLIQLAQLKKGDKILIHAASGGVGMAAVKIAHALGAEIHATASPGKWPYLKSLGIKCLMNSRTLAFSDELRHQTGNQGVDVVLNSLNDEFIPHSLAVLKSGGRFIEIGKIGIWSPEQMRKERPDVSYFPFDLNDVAREQPALIQEMLQKMHHAVTQATFTPLPLQTFSIHDAGAAFEFMAQTRHIGKVVISVNESSPAKSLANGSVLITGGTGALGLQLAAAMAQKGVKRLILVSRTPPDEATRQRIADLQADVKLIQADVVDHTRLKHVFDTITQAGPPLIGIIHCAGTLDDGLLANLDASRFRSVLAPKIIGTWNLHVLSQNCALDFFVMFSSIAAVLGNAGQSSYAAANAFMDQMAHYRRSRGLPGIAINWGAWQNGMAATTVRLAQQGARAIAPETALNMFHHILDANPANVCALDMDWLQYIKNLQADALPPLLSHFNLSPHDPAAQETPNAVILEQLAEAPAGRHQDLFLVYLSDLAAHVLGNGHHRLPPDKPLMEQGFDSLMAVELRNRLSRDLQQPLPASLLFDYPTLNKISRFILDEVIPSSAGEALQNKEPSDIKRPPPPPEALSAADVLNEIENLLE